jgi:protein-S-isoprenylcysteine O-methyltransferase Ste14
LITWEKIFLVLSIIFLLAAMYVAGLVGSYFYRSNRARHIDPQDERWAKKHNIVGSVLSGLFLGFAGAAIQVTRLESPQDVLSMICSVILVIVGTSIFIWVGMSLIILAYREYFRYSIWPRDKK